jgi:hypothetical protein
MHCLNNLVRNTRLVCMPQTKVRSLVPKSTRDPCMTKDNIIQEFQEQSSQDLSLENARRRDQCRIEYRHALNKNHNSLRLVEPQVKGPEYKLFRTVRIECDENVGLSWILDKEVVNHSSGEPRFPRANHRRTSCLDSGVVSFTCISSWPDARR